MATSQQQLVCDNSTLANFKAWASAISGCFSTFGWVQAADTGQVDWSTIASVPGSGAYVYEVWTPGDGLTAFYLKVEYGNSSGTNSPGLRLTLSTATDGAGTPSAFVSAAFKTTITANTPPSTTTQYECDFSGTNSRFCAMLWRNATNNVQQMFAVERSLDSSGTPTSSYVTIYACGWVGGSPAPNGYQPCCQQSVAFGLGTAPGTGTSDGARINGGSGFGLRVMSAYPGTGAVSFGGSIPFDTAAPQVGYWDCPGTAVGAGNAVDYAEGVPFSVTLYGATRTYMPGKLGAFQYAALTFSAATAVLCVRYD